jgi:hypothetical protein
MGLYISALHNSFVLKGNMESFELKIEEKTYKVVKLVAQKFTFSVFNYSSFHTIAKIQSGRWAVIEHRFGNHQIPLQQIGKSIEAYLGI